MNNLMTEKIMIHAGQVVNTLLEQGGDAEVEYDTVDVDSMPHTAWMVRAIGSSPTQYVARDVAHTPELARQRAHEKARSLGMTITREIDRSKSSPRS